MMQIDKILNSIAGKLPTNDNDNINCSVQDIRNALQEAFNAGLQFSVKALIVAKKKDHEDE